jgi:glycosyltransferase involved in cell wall biosynthesis
MCDAVPHKVLLFIPHLQQGGAERQILELMNRLPSRFAPTLCVYRREEAHYGDYLPAGEPRHVLGVDAMGPRGLRRLVDVLRAERPAIVHAYRDKANFWARVATRSAPVPIVLTSVRTRNMGPHMFFAERILGERSDRVIANSVGTRRELETFAGVRREKIQIIHNFVDVEKFRPPTEQERRAARERHALAPDDVALILPARMSLQKHQLGLALALRRLDRAGKLGGHVKILLAGRTQHATYGRIVDRLCRSFGVDRAITSLGVVKDMVCLYHAADALLMPSLYEGLSNVVLEAQASGLPAIVSHAANLDGLVVDGVSGFEHATLDDAGLARAIDRIVSMSDADRRRMGAAGRAHIEAEFHPDRILAETVALYDELLAEKGLV